MSYVIDHWRGRHSLARSFWLNGLAANLAGAAVAGLAQWLIARQAADNPAGMLAGLLGMWALLIVLTFWQVVGAWRSAERHRRDGRAVHWATVAKLALVIAVLVSAATMFHGGRQVVHIARITFGLDGLHGTVTRQGDALVLSGHITFDMPGQVARLLAESPPPRRLVLDSAGGYIGPAEAIRAQVAAAGLDTAARRQCLSACTLIFVAGERRLAPPGTRFGFHGFSLPGVSRDDLAAEEEKAMAYWRAQGVDDAFVARAFAGTEMWFPSMEEMVAAGFIGASRTAAPPQPPPYGR